MSIPGDNPLGEGLASALEQLVLTLRASSPAAGPLRIEAACGSLQLRLELHDRSAPACLRESLRPVCHTTAEAARAALLTQTGPSPERDTEAVPASTIEGAAS